MRWANKPIRAAPRLHIRSRNPVSALSTIISPQERDAAVTWHAANGQRRSLVQLCENDPQAPTQAALLERRRTDPRTRRREDGLATRRRASIGKALPHDGVSLRIRTTTAAPRAPVPRSQRSCTGHSSPTSGCPWCARAPASSRPAPCSMQPWGCPYGLIGPSHTRS